MFREREREHVGSETFSTFCLIPWLFFILVLNQITFFMSSNVVKCIWNFCYCVNAENNKMCCLELFLRRKWTEFGNSMEKRFNFRCDIVYLLLTFFIWNIWFVWKESFHNGKNRYFCLSPYGSQILNLIDLYNSYTECELVEWHKWDST